MSKESHDVAIWMPLRPGSSWRGEGIAQTVENIISNISADINCTLVVSREHASDLEHILDKCPNIKLAKLGFFNKKEVVITEGSIPSSSVFQLILSKVKIPFIKKIRRLISNVSYLTTLILFTYLHRYGLFLSKCKVVWIPTPIIPYTEHLGGKKVFSFWDPFVFEYRDFSDISPALYKHFKYLYQHADCIITQSQENRSFLESVLNVSDKEIQVINNGSPDFSEYLPLFELYDRTDYSRILNIWSQPAYRAEDISSAFDKMVADNINKSVLWRLTRKLNHLDNKIIMVSTQLRPYKGFGVLFEILDSLIKNEADVHYQVILTSEVPKWVKDKYPLLYERIHEIVRVSNKQLALLYYISDLVLHPSYVEGGLGVYPQFEAASVGTPSLVNIGRHVQEHGDCGLPPPLTSGYFVDVNDIVVRINSLMFSQNERDLNIEESNNLAIKWKDSAKKYDNIFMSR